MNRSHQPMKRFRIIIDVTGDPPIVEANDAQEAADEFRAGVSGDALLQLIEISAEEITDT